PPVPDLPDVIPDTLKSRADSLRDSLRVKPDTVIDTVRVRRDTLPGSVDQPERHDEGEGARGVIPAPRFAGRSTFGGFERHANLVGRHEFEYFQQIRRVEADLQSIALVGDSQLFLRLAQVRRLDGELAGSVRKGHSDAMGLVAGDDTHAAQRGG